MTFLSLLILALAVTIVVEFAVYYLFIDQAPRDLLLYSILINCFTNPLFNYFYNYGLHQYVPLEAAVVAVESVLLVLLARIGLFRALTISFAANLVSLLAGIILTS